MLNGVRADEHQGLRGSTLEYTPDTSGLKELVLRLSPQRVLLIGFGEVHGLLSDEVRVAEPPGPVVANGAYAFRSGEQVDLLLCAGGPRPGSPVAATPEADLPDDHPLVKAQGWFDYLWEQGVAVGPGPRFNAGDYVKVAGSGQIGRVESRRRHDGENVYSVSIDGQRHSISEAGLLPHEVDANDLRSWLATEPATARELSVSLTLTKLTNPLTDTIYSYLSSKTVIRPYQFRPVLRLLGSPHQRLLIADEVGLGKTIEAGLIWTELEARNAGMHRVLVVCPAALVHKWRDEMRRRFDRELTILDKNGLTQLVSTLRSGDDDKQLFGVASLEGLRSSKLLADLNDAQPRFDLVIVDEAHYLRNRSTLSHALGRLLSDWAETLLFLSATPLNLGNDDLFNLLNLLVDEEFADSRVFPLQVEPNRHLNALAGKLLDKSANPRALLPILDRVRGCELGEGVVQRPEFHRLRSLLDRTSELHWQELAEAKRLLSELNSLSSVLTRTRKVDVPDRKAVREPVQIDVEWTPAERYCYQAVLAWARGRCAVTGGFPGFTTQMPLRQAASCLPVMRDRLLEGDRSLTSNDGNVDDLNDVENWSAGEDDENLSLEEIRSAVAGLGDVDTKFDRFIDKLGEARMQCGGQVLVFSFFRRTLSYLEHRLRQLGWRVRSMHGGVPVHDRQRLIDQFRAGEFDLLLTSEVGSEGLDFEFCSTIVNYDVPWNPMKLEQRIGRLDRMGQEHEKIFILNFHVPGTIETDMFGRLYKRINVFRESVGELEPILRDEFSQVQKVALDPTLTDAQRQRRLGEIEVAIEARRAQLDDLKVAQSQLAGIDQLLIDGFEKDTTSRGRFIGGSELRTLLEEFFADGTKAASLTERSLSIGRPPKGGLRCRPQTRV